MNDQRQAAPEQRDTREQRQRVAWLLLILSPFTFVFCWILARVQDASLRDALMIATAGFVMCLGFAGHYMLRGMRSSDDLFWLNIILNLFRR